MQVLVAITTPLYVHTKIELKSHNKRTKLILKWKIYVTNTINTQKKWEKRWFKEVRIICCVAPRKHQEVGIEIRNFECVTSFYSCTILIRFQSIERVFMHIIRFSIFALYILITDRFFSSFRTTCVSNYDQIMWCLYLIFWEK